MVRNKLSLSITARILATRALDNGSAPAPFFFFGMGFFYFSKLQPPAEHTTGVVDGGGRGEGGGLCWQSCLPFLPVEETPSP